MNVMLLAAGEGTRLRPYTLTVPKPAMPFLGVPLAAHALSFLHSLSIDKLVVNTYHLPEKIHELFHSFSAYSSHLHFSDEKGELLGSGGGLGNARSHFIHGGDFVLMNADEVILPQDPLIMQKALEQHRQSQALATLMVMEHPGVGSQFGGVWTSSDSRTVAGFGKTPPSANTKGWHFVGVQILSDRVFKYIPASGPSNILYDCLVQGIQNGERVEAFPFQCTWFETGNPQDFFAAEKECQNFLKSSSEDYRKHALQKCLSLFSPLK
ncbi:MAG: sugar phosphate nucleotidyltransferase [Bdellovibrio sp.]